MGSKQKLSHKLFISGVLFALILIFITLIDSQNSSIKNGEITLNTSSTTSTCSDISQYIFSTNLVKKNQLIEDFVNKFLNYDYGGIFKNLKKKINDLYSGVNEIVNYKKIQNFRNIYMTLYPKNNKPLFGITPEHSIFKLKKDCGNLPEPVKEINDYSCKGEWESVQIIIVPFTDTLKQVEVKITGLPFPAKNLECLWGEYAWCNESFYPADSGWVTDPLIPMDIDTSGGHIRYKCSIIPSVIPKGEARSVWLNYFVPVSMKPGEYSFEVTVSALNNNKREEQNTSVKLNVFNYCLPKTTHLKTAFSFDENALMEYYDISKIPEALQKEYYQFLLNYHLNPVSLYTNIDNTFPATEDWQWCVDRGANYFNLGYLNNISSDSVNAMKSWKDKLLLKINYLKQNNLLDFAYVYGFDEVDEGNYPNLKYMSGQLHKVNKDIPFVCTTAPVNELSGFVDIWVPNFVGFREDKKPFNQNEKMWEYICCMYKKSCPNLFIEYPAIDPRIIFWQCSKNNIDGFLYYNINNWHFNMNTAGLTAADNPYIDKINKGIRWPDIPWVGHSFRWNVGQKYYNGDGQLIYPGKNMKLYPSIRLINIREGIEDYEYFYQLKILQKKFRKNRDINKTAIIEKFLAKAYLWASSYKDYENNPDELLRLKSIAGTLLENCLK